MIAPEVDNGIAGPIEAPIDYMYLHERIEKNCETKYNVPHFILIEHKHGRCWAHQVLKKGAHDRASWLPIRMVQALDNNGLKVAKIQLKSDQEPAIVNIQTAVQEIRPGTVIFTNRPVGITM